VAADGEVLRRQIGHCRPGRGAGRERDRRPGRRERAARVDVVGADAAVGLPGDCPGFVEGPLRGVEHIPMALVGRRPDAGRPARVTGTGASPPEMVAVAATGKLKVRTEPSPLLSAVTVAESATGVGWTVSVAGALEASGGWPFETRQWNAAPLSLIEVGAVV